MTKKTDKEKTGYHIALEGQGRVGMEVCFILKMNGT